MTIHCAGFDEEAEQARDVTCHYKFDLSIPIHIRHVQLYYAYINPVCPSGSIFKIIFFVTGYLSLIVILHRCESN